MDYVTGNCRGGGITIDATKSPDNLLTDERPLMKQSNAGGWLGSRSLGEESSFRQSGPEVKL